LEPKAIQVMDRPFDAVCKSLQSLNRHDPIIAIVARKVIDIEGTGEHDPSGCVIWGCLS
jgi:hypothetical protein